MADNSTRTDAPPPPPPRPPEQSLKPSPEFQQKLDDFRAQKEAKQDAGQYVDHRAAKAENTAARNDGAAQPQRAGDKPQRTESRSEPQGLRPSPEFQQKLDDFRAQKEAKQDAAQYVDNRVAKNGAARSEREGTTPQQDPRSRERQGGTQQKDSGNAGDKPPGPPGPGPEGHDRRVYAAKHLKPEADLRDKTGPAEPVESTQPGSRPSGAHYRDEGTTGNDHGKSPSGIGLYPESTYFPAKDGALGQTWEQPDTRPDTTERRDFLPVGSQIDRYGRDGSYAAPAGTPIEQRALPPGTDLTKLDRYEVIRPLPDDSYQQSVTASYYNERDGGGLQYVFTTPLSDLERRGFLRKIDE